MKVVCRSLWLALAAALALSALSSGAALAAPPEFQGPSPDTFELKSDSTSVVLQRNNPNHTLVSCTGKGMLSGKGEITGAHASTATLTLTKCTGFSGKCSTAGAREGEIKTTELAAKLGYITEATGVGIVFQPKAGERATFAEFSCAGKETLKVTGGVIATDVRPLNAETSQFNLALIQHNGAQQPYEYENEEHSYSKVYLEVEGSGQEEFHSQSAALGGPNEKPEMTAAVVAAKATKILAEPPSGPKFTSNGKFSGSLGQTTLESGSTLLAYQSGEISGEIAGKTSVANVTIKLNGSTNGCNNEESNLVWKGLDGRLGYINKAKEEVGLVFESVTEPIAKCSSKAVGFDAYGGHLVVPITPIGSRTKQFHLGVSKAGSLSLEGEAADPLITGTWASNRWEGTKALTLTGSEWGFTTENEDEVVL